MHTHQVLRFGRFTLDSACGRLQSDGVDVELRPKSSEVLRQLVENAGRVVSKDELARAVWSDVVVTDDSLVQCIHDVRKALGDDARLIKTLPRRGYMFVGRVEAGPAPGAPPPVRPRPALPIIGSALALALCTALVGWAVTRHWHEKTEPELAIAVLPFASLGTDEDRHFSDGLTEDIITAISRFRDVTVIARSASFRLRGEEDASRAGQKLGAAFVVRGSVGQDQERVRIHVQLVDARSGATRWADRYDRPVRAVFELQDEVAEQLVANLVAHARHVAAERVRARHPATLQAYELVLRARQRFAAFSREGAIEALALLQQAVAMDPAYAPAWELLARVLLLRFHVVPHDERHSSPDTLAQAHQAALQAVALDPSLSLAHGALGYAQLWMQQHDAAQASLRRAIALNPNDADTLRNYGDALGRAGDQKASIDVLERSRRLDPFSPPIVLGLLARAHNMLGEHEKALPAARECSERAPDLPMCPLMRAIAASRLGHADEAKAAVRQLLAVDPTASIRRWTQPRRFVRASDEALWAEQLRMSGLPD